MTKSKKTKINYFKNADGKIIYPAGLGRRFSARLLDMLMAVIVGQLIISIVKGVSYNPALNTSMYNTVGWGNAGAGSTITPYNTSSLAQLIPHFYSWFIVVGLVLVILGVFCFLILIPLMNKTNPGQSIGKKLLKITPMYLNDNPHWKSILKREALISGFYMLIPTFALIIGITPMWASIQYSSYVNSVTGVQGFPTAATINQAGWIQTNSIWVFMYTVWWNPSVMGTLAASPYQIVFATFYQITLIAWFVWITILIITIAFNPQKRGLHDAAASSAVVNLKLVYDSLEEAHGRRPDLIIQGYEEVENFDQNNEVKWGQSESSQHYVDLDNETKEKQNINTRLYLEKLKQIEDINKVRIEDKLKHFDSNPYLKDNEITNTLTKDNNNNHAEHEKDIPENNKSEETLTSKKTLNNKNQSEKIDGDDVYDFTDET